jgi:hypothetical protein
MPIARRFYSTVRNFSHCKHTALLAVFNPQVCPKGTLLPGNPAPRNPCFQEALLLEFSIPGKPVPWIPSFKETRRLGLLGSGKSCPQEMLLPGNPALRKLCFEETLLSGNLTAGIPAPGKPLPGTPRNFDPRNPSLLETSLYGSPASRKLCSYEYLLLGISVQAILLLGNPIAKKTLLLGTLLGNPAAG